jgi:alpha-N-arabinofuranosidase
MYGRWQLGFMPLAEYVNKHNALSDAIKSIDPSARLVGVGSVGAWDEGILAGSSDRMNLISEHVYRKEMPDVEAHSRQIADDVERIALAHRNYRRSIPVLAGKDLRIAMDEWNYWYGDYVYGELGVQYHLKDALGIARGLHAFFRNSDIYFMANYAQTVNVLGAIKTSRTEATFDTTGLVLKLYRDRFGSIPVSIPGTTGKLDVSAALTEDGKALTIAVVNPEQSAQGLLFDIRPKVPSGKGTAWTLTGPNPASSNAPGKPPEVIVTESSFSSNDTGLKVPSFSVTVFRFDLK